MCWHSLFFSLVINPLLYLFLSWLAPILLAQRLLSPVKSVCVWGVLGDLWPSCKLSRWILCPIAGRSGLHVQPHRGDRSPHHAEGLCDGRVARQPRPPHVPGVYEVECENEPEGNAGFSWGELEGQCERFCCFSVWSCPSAARALVSVPVLPVDLVWRGAFSDQQRYSPASHLTDGEDFFSSTQSPGTFLPASFLGTILPADASHTCLCHGSISQPQTRSQVTQGHFSVLWSADVMPTCCVSFLLASGNALGSFKSVRKTNYCVAGPI